MILFKNEIYICLESNKTPDGVWGYCVKGYDIDNDGHIYLYSGSANIKHDINDLKRNYREYIIDEINKNNNG